MIMPHNEATSFNQDTQNSEYEPHQSELRSKGVYPLVAKTLQYNVVRS